MNLRPIHAAAVRGDYAAVLRLARVARGWTQSQLGQRANLSRTVVSRFETGDRALRDVELRRRLADALGLPVEMFGLYGSGGPKIGGTVSEGDDVRRRSFLVAAGAAMLPSGQAFAKADPSSDMASVQVLTQRVEQALIHPERGRVLGPTVVKDTLAAARADYRATRYLPMADRLIDLVSSAEAQLAETAEPSVYAIVADVYNAVANLLCKLPASGLEWMAIDRALRAGRLAEEPLLIAESQRLLSAACRRAGRAEQALDVCTAAADQLHRARGTDVDIRTAEVLCTASYCAAKARDRDRAVELLREARRFAERPQANGRQWTEFTGVNNINVYAVSVGTAVGDLGMAFRAIRAVNVAALASVERRSRFLVDAATAQLAAGQTRRAAQTLLVAERISPQAVTTRPAAVALARALG